MLVLINTNILGIVLYLVEKGGNNAVIFGVEMSSSVHIHHKKVNILVLGKRSTQQLGEHSLAAEKMYSINLSATKRRFCLSLHYIGANAIWL